MKALFRKRLQGIFPDSEDGLKLLTKMGQGDLCEVVFNTGKRSLPMNALSHVWYNDIAKETEDIPEDVKCECKLHYGVPILRAEDDQFREFYDSAVKNTLSYEQKKKAMRFIPVTSLMNPEQMHRYLTHMERHYAQQGIILESRGEYEDMKNGTN